MREVALRRGWCPTDCSRAKSICSYIAAEIIGRHISQKKRTNTKIYHYDGCHGHKYHT